MLQKFSIKARLIGLIYFTGLSLLLFTGIVVWFNTASSLYKEKEVQVSYVTEIVYELVEAYKARADEGEFTEEEAKAEALEKISSLNFDKNNYIWVNDYDGIMLSHPKAKLIGKSVWDLADKKGNKLFQEVIRIAKDKGEGKYTYYWSKPGKDKNQAFEKESYVRGYAPWGWVIGAGVYTDEIQSQLLEFMLVIAGYYFVILIVVNIIAYITIGKSIIDPILEITGISKKLATNDLTVEIPIDNNKTEIGELNRSFKQFVDNLKGLIGQIGKSTDEISSGSEQMHAAADQTSQGAQQVSQSITQLAQGANEQATDVTSGIENINKINVAIQKIAETAKSTVKLAENTESNADQGKVEAGQAVDKINRIKETATEVAETINELGKLSSEIGQILDLIRSVASQTNLLALNAAIEAARAGEHGKGFAVVAEEVKKLASQSAQATDNISEMIGEIQNKINHAVVSMEGSIVEVQEGVEIVDNTGQSLVQILEAAKDTSTQIEEINQEVENLSQNSESVVKMMENIASITEESAASSEQISSVSQEQTASIEEINASSSALAKIAEDLQKQIQRFKI